jgi:DNA ligase-1
VRKKAKELPIKVIVYDLLYLDGKDWMAKPFQERRKQLEKVMEGVKDGLELTEQEVVSEVKHLRRLLKKYLDEGLEGVMCKKLTTPYQAGSRNFNWVKFKKTTEGELADTLDCVVMGHYAGRGRRSGFGIGAFLVGIVDNKGRIGTVAKIGTGLADEQWREMKRRCDKLKTDKKPSQYVVDKNLEPDVWVRPEMVVEIMADEITRSPIHAFGLALRFPRLVRIRDDKNVSQATTRKELKRLHRLQKG